ncbi:MAG: hypothetical protein ACTSUL_04865 [Promethearchaeota archaeon]
MENSSNNNEIIFAKQTTINDIKNDDMKVQIVGKVHKILDEYHFILDDTTGNIVINTGDIDFSFNEGDLIKVIGDLQINLEGDKEIKAEIVNDMKGLNFDYYLRLYNLKKEFL